MKLAGVLETEMNRLVSALGAASIRWIVLSEPPAIVPTSAMYGTPSTPFVPQPRFCQTVVLEQDWL